jgi:NADH-quinone oxidoreductase subunit G
MVKVTIDGIEIEVEEGTTILNAARQVGGDIVPPAMCYYSKLEGSGGKCRTCLVEVAAGSERDPRPMPKLMVSCSTQVQHGMVVKNITSDRVKEARAGVTEFLLANHPLDCPVCDQAGECHLQDLGFENGKEGTRFEEEKRTFAPRDIGDKIKCLCCQSIDRKTRSWSFEQRRSCGNQYIH